MKHELSFTIGTMVYDDKHKFFWGRVNGMQVTMNLGKDKDGKDLWYVKQQVDAWIVPSEEKDAKTPGK